MKHILIVIHLSSVLCCLVSLVCCLWSTNGPSTLVENPLQIDLFMQNKPKVKNAQINVSSFITSKYVKMDNWSNRKNKPNQTQFKPKTKPVSKKPKMSVSIYYINDYENYIPLAGQKTNPKQTQFKPNSNPILSAVGGLPKGQNECKVTSKKSGLQPKICKNIRFKV